MLTLLQRLYQLVQTLPFLMASGFAIAISFFGQYLLPIAGVNSATLVISFAWITVIISGIPLVFDGLHALITRRQLTSSLLITLAMMAGIYSNDVFTAGEVAFLMALARWLEGQTIENAKKTMESLSGFMPTEGRVVKNMGGVPTEVMTSILEIEVDSILRVLPDERFPCDGIVLSDTTLVDQSALTGESIPIEKKKGDHVLTGTLNTFSTVDIQVTGTYKESAFQTMLELVEKAESTRVHKEKVVDLWASYFVPAALLTSLLTFLILNFLFGRPEDAMQRAVTVLVVFCPCALTLATPISNMTAIAQARQQGILIKSGEALETLSHVTTIALDKTGTLTKGLLTVKEVSTCNIPKEELLILAATVEAPSDHPLAKAVVTHCKKLQLPFLMEDLIHSKEFVGKGITGEISRSQFYCGNERLLIDEAKISIPQEIIKYLAQLRSKGLATVVVSDEERVLGVIALSDRLRPKTKSSLKKLEQLGIEHKLLLTGDQRDTTLFTAKQVGFSPKEVHTSLLPEQKAKIISERIKKGEVVCMVGDGLNDAPSLKTAHVGISLGITPNEISLEAADIAILGEDLSKIPYLKQLADKTVESIKYHISMSMFLNLGAICVSLTGLLTPATAALVHNAGSIIVVFSASRYLSKDDKSAEASQ